MERGADMMSALPLASIARRPARAKRKSQAHLALSLLGAARKREFEVLNKPDSVATATIKKKPTRAKWKNREQEQPIISQIPPQPLPNVRPNQSRQCQKPLVKRAAFRQQRLPQEHRQQHRQVGEMRYLLLATLFLVLVFGPMTPWAELKARAEPAGEPSLELAEGLSLAHRPAHQVDEAQQAEPWAGPELELLERAKQEARLSVQVGQNVVLNCAVHFKDGLEKPFVVNWFKYPHRLPIYIFYAGYPPHVAQGYEQRVSRIGQASLNLSQVRDSDQGLYECKINYLDRWPQEQSNGTLLFLEVQAPPRFTKTPAPVSYVQAGDPVRLVCQAESRPAPLLRWFRNKLPIETDSGPYRLLAAEPQQRPPEGPSSAREVTNELLGSPQLSQLDLMIESVQAGQSTGDYRCLASNSEGSVEARAQVALAVGPVITQLPRSQTLLEGDRLEMQCSARALPNNISYKWLFNDKPIQQLKWFEGRHSVRRDGTLVLAAVHRDDQGHYKCRASNGLAPSRAHTAGRAGPAPSSTSGQALAAPDYAEAGAQLWVEYPARVSHSASPQFLPLGLSGLIQCHVQANPKVDFFTWTLNNQHLEPNSDPNIERLANGSLLVRQVTRHYQGLYRCTPFNKHGSAGSSAAMEVRVEEPPAFRLRPADFYKAPAGGHQSMACEAQPSAAQPTSLTWRRLLEPEEPPPPPPPPPPPEEGSSEDASSNQTEAGPQQESSSEYPPGSESQSEQPTQQSVIPVEPKYAKLPADRAEFRDSQLILHALRKEDHGRYECVIENGVATLIASTMLYVDETTPHAPSHVRVQTRTWSAQVSWKAGYDGGFEQSFAVWYRQVPRASQPSPVNEPIRPRAAALGLVRVQHEQADFNWRSAGSQPAEATSFTVQNLSQDTSYEFYVRPRNIIGEGPRSPVVSASTKRALAGPLSLAPTLSSLLEPLTSGQPADESQQQQAKATTEPTDQDKQASSSVNPALLGIIHLVDYSSANGSGPSTPSAPSSDTSEPSANLSKVIRIYFPSRGSASANASIASSMAGASNASSSSETPPTNKRQLEPADPPEPPVRPEDPSAPQNLTITKVAQGWVLNWWPPRKLARAGQDPALGPQPLESSAAQTGAAGQPLAYLAEFREFPNGTWLPVPVANPIGGRERSLLMRQLKPGTEYRFRMFALAPGGVRGPASLELRHSMPERKRPMGTLSAGIVSGVLFFVACIVIAVCTVNLCNKRRKERAEKAAYVMMACPVLESHHDIAALNSNSLMKKNKPALEMNSLLNPHLAAPAPRKVEYQV